MYLEQPINCRILATALTNTFVILKILFLQYINWKVLKYHLYIHTMPIAESASLCLVNTSFLLCEIGLSALSDQLVLKC